ncbi:DUF1963 domain-containing protein [Actinomadura sp. 7K507]|nr:DUF1963 domain-containing protein [Actinomadura sp. 7K507]
MLDKLSRFREQALARDIPSADVERWIGTARPCAILNPRADGPVVGRLGGPVMIPADEPDPVCPLVASIDLAALPKYATDLPLPPDGHLLLFAYPDVDLIGGSDSLGDAVYIPAGTAVEERQVDLEPDNEVAQMNFPQGRLCLRTDVSLPYHQEILDPGPPPVSKRLPDHPYVSELQDAWEGMPGDGIDFHPGLQIGGYAEDEYREEDPAVIAGRLAATEIRPEDWVLLAQWYSGVDGLGMACFWWAIAKQDLAARRFDRVFAAMTNNP